MKKTRLICFPYAGGSAVLFNKWERYLDPAIELIAMELAGRGSRIGDGAYADLSAAVEDMMRLTEKAIADAPYALFGHSMGCLIAYELVQKIRDTGLPRPLHLFFSGRRAPHTKKDRPKVHLMEDQAFREQLVRLGGTPPEFFQSAELMELFLPILKNDFKLAETDVHDRKVRPLDSNISVFLGREDEITSEQADGWKMHTNRDCSIHYFDGGHFFIKDSTEQIIQLINEALSCDLAAFANC